MNVKIDQNKDFTEIKICTDKLDKKNALTLKSEFVMTASKGAKNIILNAQDCKECDMSGLSALLIADRLCKNADGIFVLAGVNSNVYQLLQVAKLENVLNIVSDFSTAEQLIRTKERA